LPTKILLDRFILRLLIMNFPLLKKELNFSHSPDTEKRRESARMPPSRPKGNRYSLHGV
jgi:hypothetical protein